jgi:hypothetical protein
MLPLYTLCMLKSKALKGESGYDCGTNFQAATLHATYERITCESSARYPSMGS